MIAPLLVLALALPVVAGDLGGHADPQAGREAASAPDERRATLEEMWQRRLLPPDQSFWAPRDLELLQTIRRAETGAIAFLKRRHVGGRPYVLRVRSAGGLAVAKLTKDGYEKYVFLLTQDAIDFFEAKGADAKWVFKLRDWDGKPMFDGGGRITDEGRRVYDRARLNLETFWRDPEGQIYGTRRPPTKTP